MKEQLRRFVLVALLVLSSTVSGFAAIDIDAIKEDLRPASGYLVMPVSDQYLIDLDAASGLRPGDLLSVIEEGRKILHPVTGEVIGSLDRVKSVLQVTQVKTGYSYAKQIGAKEELKAGEHVRRFEQVPAIFWDYSGNGESIYQDLAAGLAHFDWQSYSEAQSSRPDSPQALQNGDPAVLFIHDKDGLSIKSADLTPLRSYSATVANTTVTPKTAAYQQSQMTAYQQPQKNVLGSIPLIGRFIQPENQPVTRGIVRRNMAQSQEGIWTGPTVSSDVIGVEVAELDGDGKLEIAMLLKDYLQITRIEAGDLNQVAKIDIPRGLKVLHIDGVDLSGDGLAELYITAARDAKIDSFVVEYQAGGYQITKKNLSWYFSAKELPNEGRVLTGQESDYHEQNDFVGEPFRVALQGSTLVKSQTLPVPGNFTLYDYHQFTGQDSVRRVAGLTEGGGLVVAMPEGIQLWKSGETLGGSLSKIERYINVNAKSVEGKRTQYLRARISSGPNGELLVPVNEGSRLLARSRSFDTSHLRAYVWNGSMLQESWRTIPQGGYLADYRIADADNDGDDELIMAVGYSREGFASKAMSGLVVYDLQ